MKQIQNNKPSWPVKRDAESPNGYLENEKISDGQSCRSTDLIIV